MATTVVSETNTSARNNTVPTSYSPPKAVRNRLPDERVSVTHKFEVGGHEGYLTVGLYPDRQPGELFVTMAKEGSTVSGLISSFAQAISIGLQHGVPLTLFCEKFAHTRFEPSGWSGNPDIRHASSVMDYIFRWLQLKFGRPDNGLAADHTATAAINPPQHRLAQSEQDTQAEHPIPSSDAPACKHCGSITQRNGSCYVCINCGSSSGCG